MTNSIISFARTKYCSTTFFCYNLFAIVFYPFYAQIVIYGDKAQDFWHTYHAIANQSLYIRSAPFLLKFLFDVVDSPQAFSLFILTLFVFSINIFSFLFLFLIFPISYVTSNVFCHSITPFQNSFVDLYKEFKLFEMISVFYAQIFYGKMQSDTIL